MKRVLFFLILFLVLFGTAGIAIYRNELVHKEIEKKYGLTEEQKQLYQKIDEMSEEFKKFQEENDAKITNKCLVL